MFFSALVFSAFLELGGMFGGIYNYPVPEPITMFPLYTTIAADVEYEGFYVGGQMDCYYLAEKVTNYKPFQNTYIFRAGYRRDGFTLGFEHSCFHPFSTYATIFPAEIKPKYEGFVDKVFVRIETQ